MNRCISPGVEGVYVSKQKRRRVVQPDEFHQVMTTDVISACCIALESKGRLY